MSDASNLTWGDLRDVHISELKLGDVTLQLPAMTVCWVSEDGRVRGNNWMQPTGRTWTVTDVSDGKVTAVRDDGLQDTQDVAVASEWAKVTRIERR